MHVLNMIKRNTLLICECLSPIYECQHINRSIYLFSSGTSDKCSVNAGASIQGVLTN